MRLRPSVVLPASALLLAMIVGRVSAATFSDVSSSHPFATAIITLADMGVIKGYDDGRFGPNDPVTRAQMVTLAYRLKGVTPPTMTTACFSDVKPPMWHVNWVCDAAAKGYVKGYADGKFQPDKTVTRAEALKIFFAVFEIEPTDGVMIYPDVSEADWFYPYVGAALRRSILPIPGQEDRYQGNVAMYRGEVAQMLYQAIASVKPEEAQEEEVIIEEETPSEETPSETEETTPAKTKTIVPTYGYSAATETKAVTLPFSFSGSFEGHETRVYTFDVSEDSVMKFYVVSTGQHNPDCRLYKLENDGLTFEYYLGAKGGNECWMRVALGAGKYQFELTADPGDVRVTAESATGDGSDGFVQAKPIARAKNVTADLPEDDSADWFTFSVTRQTVMTMGVTNQGSTSTLQCIIYPMRDVSFNGFDFPACNKEFTYEKGTYIVGVMHSLSALKTGQRRKETAIVRLE